MVAVGKKHRVDQIAEQTQTLLAKDKFRQQGQVMDDIIRVISRSSMVSMFEKPKFRDYVNGLSRDDRAYLAAGFKEMLHFKNSPIHRVVPDFVIQMGDITVGDGTGGNC